VAGRLINVATSRRVTLNQLFAALKELIGASVEPLYAEPRPGDVRHSQADISLARQALGYEPSVSFEEGLRLTLEWYRGQARGDSTPLPATPVTPGNRK
jgi:nucleoside-diphosphate-sugar epimerase